jgi:hypothetical protein
MADEHREPGVFAAGRDGNQCLVHLYQGGEYALIDVVELLQVGRVVEPGGDSEPVIELDRKELETLQAQAHAFSFDYPEPFIEMCLEMYRFAASVPGERVRFSANF